ncbi:hypothetical protein BKH46_09195 [Helicobacter sp. 12S02634-8]|uniref:hypothetical protein n=1 Tax=Helicobacter sp. 12S02634-8 TaxID=1476199 RepID=UPI000BA62079|nr:hypothetical protein [Helicobacter sp. 12S02634-8]PAF45826.1 hypothetical protein BKH46_09195 [Helicobacter sp. 12S02634-8]
MNSSITLDIKANLEDLNKAISRVTKATKLDLGLKIGLKNNMPKAEIEEIGKEQKKSKEKTKVVGKGAGIFV